MHCFANNYAWIFESFINSSLFGFGLCCQCHIFHSSEIRPKIVKHQLCNLQYGLEN